MLWSLNIRITGIQFFFSIIIASHLIYFPIHMWIFPDRTCVQNIYSRDWMEYEPNSAKTSSHQLLNMVKIGLLE